MYFFYSSPRDKINTQLFVFSQIKENLIFNYMSLMVCLGEEFDNYTEIIK